MAKGKKQEIIVIQNDDLTLTQPLNDVIEKSGLEKTKAEKYALGYAPLMREVVEQADLLKPLDKTNPEDAAKAKRISLDLGKICSRLTAKKKEDKDTLLVETRLIDGLFNVAESTARLTQKDADEIVEYLESIERERKAKIADARRAELGSFGAVTDYLPLDIMGDEQYARCLEDAKFAFQARKDAAEKAEAERLEQIRQAEIAEAERVRLENERIDAERLEAIRVKDELDRKEKELVKEREKHAAELKAAEEREKKESDKREKENAEKLAEQKRIAEAEAKRIADKVAEDKKLADAEIARQKAAAEKLAAELQIKKDAEAKADAEKKAAQLAPDKEKINQLYKSLKDLQIPAFTSQECAIIGTEVLNRISHILSYIKDESKKLL